MDLMRRWGGQFDSKGTGRQPCKVCQREGKQYLGNLATGKCWDCRKQEAKK